MEKNENVFEYTYSAPQQDELKKIREKYLPKEETKRDQLRRLHESTTKKGQTCALTLGIVSALVLGVGMCCTMVWKSTLFVPGIFVGCAGILGMSVTYPLFHRITDRERQRLAPEILRLSNELTND